MSNTVKYRIFQIDNSHGLAPKDSLFNGKSERYVLLEPDIHELKYTKDSFDEAVDTVKQYGNTYVQYTIIPYIYLTINSDD